MDKPSTLVGPSCEISHLLIQQLVSKSLEKARLNEIVQLRTPSTAASQAQKVVLELGGIMAARWENARLLIEEANAQQARGDNWTGTVKCAQPKQDEYSNQLDLQNSIFQNQQLLSESVSNWSNGKGKKNNQEAHEPVKADLDNKRKLSIIKPQLKTSPFNPSEIGSPLQFSPSLLIDSAHQVPTPLKLDNKNQEGLKQKHTNEPTSTGDPLSTGDIQQETLRKLKHSISLMNRKNALQPVQRAKTSLKPSINPSQPHSYDFNGEMCKVEGIQRTPLVKNMIAINRNSARGKGRGANVSRKTKSRCQTEGDQAQDKLRSNTYQVVNFTRVEYPNPQDNKNNYHPKKKNTNNSNIHSSQTNINNQGSVAAGHQSAITADDSLRASTRPIKVDFISYRCLTQQAQIEEGVKLVCGVNSKVKRRKTMAEVSGSEQFREFIRERKISKVQFSQQTAFQIESTHRDKTTRALPAVTYKQDIKSVSQHVDTRPDVSREVSRINPNSDRYGHITINNMNLRQGIVQIEKDSGLSSQRDYLNEPIEVALNKIELSQVEKYALEYIRKQGTVAPYKVDTIPLLLPRRMSRPNKPKQKFEQSLRNFNI